MLGSDSPKIIQTSCLAYRNLWSSQGDKAAGGLWGRATLARRRDWTCRVNWWPGPRLGFSEAESRPVTAHGQDRVLCQGLALTTRICPLKPKYPILCLEKGGPWSNGKGAFTNNVRCAGVLWGRKNNPPLLFRVLGWDSCNKRQIHNNNKKYGHLTCREGTYEEWEGQIRC